MYDHERKLPNLDHLIPNLARASAEDPKLNNNNHNNKKSDSRETQPAAICKQHQSSASSSSSISSKSSSNSSSANSTSSKATRSSSDNSGNSNSTSLFWLAPKPEVTAEQQVTQQRPISRQKVAGHQQQQCVILLDALPQIVQNSTLVKQRASAKNCLAAAAVTTGASLPLMIGNRSRCVLNCLEDPPSQQPACCTPQSQVQVVATAAASQQPAAQVPSVVPKNTALRAEQRKQSHQVSVVRPVVSQHQAVQQNGHGVRLRLEDSPIWQQQQLQQTDKCSVLDDFMQLDEQINSSQKHNGLGAITNKLDLLELANQRLSQGSDQFGEQLARQQAALFRREESELNKAIRRQHKFLVGKLIDRKRGLQIVQVVWSQRGFKPAIERLVDLYHQGLIFTTNQQQKQEEEFIKHMNTSQNNSQLSSLNTSLVVDVLSVIILRPKLWSLETCRLLLPIVVNDLMLQSKTNQYENYIELALKTIKLILTHFAPIICTTLEGYRKEHIGGESNHSNNHNNGRHLVGVDLNREDRINKCLDCQKLLLEARSTLIMRRNVYISNGTANGKFTPLVRELEQMFTSFEQSLELGSR